MSSLLQVQEKLQQSLAELAHLESTLAVHPESPSLRANMRSLQKLQKGYEAQWLDENDKRGVDVCSYRLFSVGVPTINALSGALAGFQELFSVVFDALQGGPKVRARISNEVQAATSFQFGYTYPGSLGVVFTLPNKRLLPSVETGLDNAFETIKGLSHAADSEVVSEFAKQLGPATIRATYRWAKEHSDHKLGVDVQWRRNQEVRKSFLVQQPEMEHLKSAIEVLSEETSEQITVRGVLAAVNTLNRSFHLVVQALDLDIKGKYTDAISQAQQVTIPKIYTAHLNKRTRLELASGEEKTTYLLEKLEE